MRENKRLDMQMNLPLCETSPLRLSQEKQRELAVALADLLWAAAASDLSIDSEVELDHECES